MRRDSPGRYVEPEEAMAALRQAFSDEYLVDTERMEALIVMASHPVTRRTRENHLLRPLRMLLQMGFSREALIRALYAKPCRTIEANPYADQLVESKRGYRSDLRTLIGIAKAERLKNRLGFRRIGLGRPPDFFDALQGLEEGVIVPLSILGREFRVSDPYGAGYQEILVMLAERVRDMLLASGHDLWSSAIEAFPFERLELHPLAGVALHELDRQARDGLIHLPVQYGLRWRGSSMERVAWHAEHEDARAGLIFREFPLPAYAVLCEILADPHRLMSAGTLAVDCPGDVLTDTRGQHFRGGPSFVYQNKRLHLIVRPREAADAECGSATGFIAIND